MSKKDKAPAVIVVTLHAVQQYQQRLRHNGDSRTVTEEILDEVRAAYRAGLVFSAKPKSWRLYGEKGRQLPPDTRFVLSVDSTRGWIVKIDAPGMIAVVTSLSPPGSVQRITR